MSRFVTFIAYDNEDVQCLTRDEYLDEPSQSENWEEWIWQFADSKEQAIAQHYAKHDEWNEDVKSGRVEKETY